MNAEDKIMMNAEDKTRMNAAEQYIHEVLRNIHASPLERQRIEADLRAHFQEALGANEPLHAVISRMGSPLEVAAEFMSQMTLRYAGFWSRVAAFAIDMAVFIPIAAILAITAVVLANLVPQHPQGLEYVTGAIFIGLTVVCVLVVIGIILLYFPILEGRFGQTVGKKLLRMYVLKENGLPIGYKEAFLRRLSFYFEFLAPDALFALFTAKRQRAFDIVARTIVIKEERH
jgi:uncharacterized RDD family membrane protein YckC